MIDAVQINNHIRWVIPSPTFLIISTVVIFWHSKKSASLKKVNSCCFTSYWDNDDWREVENCSITEGYTLVTVFRHCLCTYRKYIWNMRTVLMEMVVLFKALSQTRPTDKKLHSVYRSQRQMCCLLYVHQSDGFLSTSYQRSVSDSKQTKQGKIDQNKWSYYFCVSEFITYRRPDFHLLRVSISLWTVGYLRAVS